MEKLWEATLDPNSPRYDDWLEILGTPIVPLKSARAFECKLGETETDEVYALDLGQFDALQHQRLVQFIQKKFGASKDAVLDELIAKGFPIRSSDVIVAFSLRAF